MSASVEATIDNGAGEGATPLLTLDGYHGSLAALLALARRQKIDLATISILELVDQLAAALRATPAATPIAQKGDWLVMAAWLVQLRARLLLPAEAPMHEAARDAADRFRNQLSDLAAIQAVAAWLDDRPLLGRDVFLRGRHVDIIDPANEAVPDIDVIEFLWASMALFDAAATGDVPDSYRPPCRDLYSVAEARARILQRLSGTPDGLPMEHLLPDEAALDRLSALRKRGAWASTLIAGLELAKQGDVRLAQAEPFTVVHVTPALTEPPD
jgi:segregation and condensation protein A